MSARAILTPRANSHPFQERAVTLEQPLKIGRSVARSRPASSNAIFDCKVLSRNHALLWYEAGKFYLQDTKSSNGTFINDVRLSKSSEESPPTQILSGDVVQFGVDVVEVTKKVTHGCIVASLQLYTPDGKEAKSSQMADKAPPTTLHDIYSLHQHIRDAAEREEKLQTKLTELEKILSNTADGVTSGWNVLIEEDRLLTRIDILERQLQASHKSMNEDKLRAEVIQLTGDKEKYQEAAKEALRKSLIDKIEVIKKCQDLERLLNAKNEDHKMMLERSGLIAVELKELAVRYEHSAKKFENLSEEMGESSLKHKDEVDSLNQKLKEEQELVQQKENVIQSLTLKAEDSTLLSQMKVAILNHNEDLNISSPSGLKPSSDSSESEPHLISSDKINEELSQLRVQVRLGEKEKKGIIERLTYLLNLFDDLKGISNKTGVSDYLKEMIGKVDIELRQVKNYTLGHEEPQHNNYTIDTLPQSNFLISQDLAHEKQNEELRDQLTKDENDIGLNKLLEEAREMVHTRKRENLTLVTDLQNIKIERDKLRDTVVKLERQSSDLVSVSVKNNELSKEVSSLKEQNLAVQKDVRALEIQVQSKDQELQSLKNAVETSRIENSHLSRIIEEQSANVLKLETEIIELKNLLPDEFPSPFVTTELETTGNDLTFKVQEIEEELATFKDRYVSSTTECSRLSRKLQEKEAFSGLFHMRWEFLVPCCLILLLAILIAFPLQQISAN